MKPLTERVARFTNLKCHSSIIADIEEGKNLLKEISTDDLKTKVSIDQK